MIIEVENLVKRYGDLIALNHFNLNVEEGEILGLLGPNGSGKTTCINCMLSLLTYDKGKIRLFNQEMKPDAYHIKKEIGVVMQEVAVFEELSVYENIDYFCSLYVNQKAKRKSLVEEAIALVGLEEFKKMKPKKLSGGLLRRLNIACGIAHKPKLIFLDEPTVAVDPQSRNRILENIKQLNAQGATIIYTTHYMEEVEQLCSRIVIMDEGKIVAQGSNDELKSMIQTHEKITFEIKAIPETILQELKGFPSILKASYHNELLEIHVDKKEGILIDLLDYFKQKKLSFKTVYSEKPTLNDVFLEITGKKLRD
ncbi:MAG: ABC transporter ATP-binding protein [Erysipelotrichia bacterium]|nr:ABC transporter ATP-binding protein [Erysipelotrichia bacterium]NCC54505.1 ABC transporter ATP-binding protein [Erysipelotrichia bacterium]